MKNNNSVIEELFERRKDEPIWNTSYPLSPSDWAPFRVDGPLPFQEEKELSFYVHIPFCKQLCSFCEYTRMICPDEHLQIRYLETLRKDIVKFKAACKDFVLRGFDIGGGTPTSLSETCFNLLMAIFDEAKEGISLSDDFEPSIEATFNTLSEGKLKRIVQSGIYRLSLGVQSTSREVLCTHHRERINIDEMCKWMKKAWDMGIKKINLDLMYGLRGQNEETFSADLKNIAVLRPQQVTLYELRTNMIKDKDVPSKETLFMQYSQYFEGLIKLGYHANFGENTFSLDVHDHGVSSYLRSRMLDGVSYKGFGLAAQSMSNAGISYNVGKSSDKLKELLAADTYQEEYTYILPKHELASKYVAIAAYNGSFSLNRVSEILGVDARKYFEEALRFALSHGYIEEESNDRIRITKEGFMYYGAVFSLFYSVS